MLINKKWLYDYIRSAHTIPLCRILLRRILLYQINTSATAITTSNASKITLTLHHYCHRCRIRALLRSTQNLITSIAVTFASHVRATHSLSHRRRENCECIGTSSWHGCLYSCTTAEKNIENRWSISVFHIDRSRTLASAVCCKFLVFTCWLTVVVERKKHTQIEK